MAKIRYCCVFSKNVRRRHEGLCPSCGSGHWPVERTMRENFLFKLRISEFSLIPARG